MPREKAQHAVLYIKFLGKAVAEALAVPLTVVRHMVHLSTFWTVRHCRRNSVPPPFIDAGSSLPLFK